MIIQSIKSFIDWLTNASIVNWFHWSLTALLMFSLELEEAGAPVHLLHITLGHLSSVAAGESISADKGFIGLPSNL